MTCHFTYVDVHGPIRPRQGHSDRLAGNSVVYTSREITIEGEVCCTLAIQMVEPYKKKC